VSEALSYGVSAGAAVLGGLSIASSAVLQQRAASRRPNGERFSVRLLVALFHDRGWLLGLGLSILSYGFQALALAFGPLTLVQPLVISELLFAIPVSVHLRGLRLGVREWLAAGAVVAGLTVGLGSASPGRGHPVQPIGRWLPALVVIGVLTAAALLTFRLARGPVRASALGFAGALVSGLQSALFSASLHLLGQRGWETFARWEPYSLVVASILGGFLIQNAFQSGPLAASSPVVDATLPMVSIGLGVLVFGEHVRTSALGLAGTVVGLVLLVAGIVALDTSPVVREEQRREKEVQGKEGHRAAGPRRDDPAGVPARA
jgi:drug/metabolite transporter (DMT)-like permease